MPRRGGILLLGAGGFLGPRLVHAALERSEGPVGAASRAPLADLAPGDAPRVEAHALDLAVAGAAEALLEAVAPRSVVLSAALSRIAQAAQEPRRAQVLNALLPGRVAAWCARRGARLVHVSTDLVFGADDAPPGGFDEGAPTGPLHVYGRSKVAGESAVLEAARGAAVPALVVRLPLLVGPSGGRGLGASDALLAALGRGERPELFRDEWRTPLHVDDAARALVECARNDLGGLLHVAGPVRLSRHELGLAVLAARGLDEQRARAALRCVRRADAGAALERARDVSLDASLARARLATPLRDPRAALATDALAGRGSPPAGAAPEPREGRLP